jgi:hypothetical protein
LGRLRPYTFHIALVLYWPILLYADSQAQTLVQQHALGVFTFALLFLATRFSPQSERRQVWVMMGIATCVELFCSVVWGLYRYRWGNVPLFVPPGHGLLYLFALRAARTPLMVSYGRTVGRVVWSVRERVAPRRWVIDGRVEGGGSGTITYTVTPHADGTTFERELVYTVPNPLLRLLDRLVLRRRIEADSAEALRRLKDVLERRAA